MNNCPDDNPSTDPERPGDGSACPVDAAREQAALEADRRLVARCLAGEESGWERLYLEYHPRLLKAIELLLGPSGADFQLVDELAARVWFALVRGEARLLARYDPQRHSRLESFLAGLARIEILRYLRSERRRKAHEWSGGRRGLGLEQIADWQISTIMSEFAATLTPTEKEFFEVSLIGPAGAVEEANPVRGLSPSNVWQRRHRIRSKLQDFFRD